MDAPSEARRPRKSRRGVFVFIWEESRERRGDAAGGAQVASVSPLAWPPWWHRRHRSVDRRAASHVPCRDGPGAPRGAWGRCRRRRRLLGRQRAGLARRDHAGLGRSQLALRGIAAQFRVLQRLHGNHALLAQRALARQHALGLLGALRGRAQGLFGTGQVVADGGAVQAHDDVAPLHALAVVLGHLQHHRGHFSTQVGSAGRLDGPADHWSTQQATGRHGAHVFRSDEQGRHGSGSLAIALGARTVIEGVEAIAAGMPSGVLVREGAE